MVHLCATPYNLHLSGFRGRPSLTLFLLVGHGELGAEKPIHPALGGNRIHVRFYQGSEVGRSVPKESERHCLSSGVYYFRLLPRPNQVVGTLHAQEGN